MSWLRPSKRSVNASLPRGPSNAYGFSTGVHGSCRLSSASASLAREKAFSLARRSVRALSHSGRETIAWVFMACGVDDPVASGNAASCSRLPCPDPPITDDLDVVPLAVLHERGVVGRPVVRT